MALSRVFTSQPQISLLFSAITFATCLVAAASDPAPISPVPSAKPVATAVAQPARAASIAENTAAAVKALGATASDSQISHVVYNAVRAEPDAVLEIVRAVVPVAPRGTADAIVAAAVTAVPNPWKLVVYQRNASPVRKLERDFKGEPDFKGGPDGKDAVAPERAGSNPADGQAMTLAEAIVQTAIDAGPGMDGGELFASVERALRGDPAWLIGAMNDPRGTSGVGDVGNNNYANEPTRRRVANLPPEIPEVPPVSR